MAATIRVTVVHFLLLVFLFSFAAKTAAQTIYLPLPNRENLLLERMEILYPADSAFQFSKSKPYSRKKAVTAAESYYQHWQRNESAQLSRVDAYKLNSLLLDNSEYLADTTLAQRKKNKTFYQRPAHLWSYQQGRNFLAVDPFFQFNLSGERERAQLPFYNSKGLALQGIINDKLGFYGSVSANQERVARYQRQWINHLPGLPALPGEGSFTQQPNNAIHYVDARGGVTFRITPYIDAQFAYDKSFIGNGYRSFILSDYSSSYLFGKLNLHIWKLNYLMIYARLMPQSNVDAAGRKLQKYFVLHHFDVNVAKGVNIGFFEAVSLGRTDHLDFSYLQPLIFLKAAERENGNPDKANVGLDFKANALHHLQAYGQFVLNEFLLSEMTHPSRGWWGNKYASQLGLKYINAGGIRNLDLQVESNRCRPFTFQHYTLVANFSNYNQPLLHPLGANFQEYIGIVRYQPLPRLQVEGKYIHYYQGLDSAGFNMGANVTANYNARPRNYGFHVGSGNRAICTYASLLFSYEVLHNLFVDLSSLARSYQTTAGKENALLFSVGIRMNMARREYDY